MGMRADVVYAILNKKIKEGGGGGTGGTANYSDLYNKPQINGFELTGNKSGDSLGLVQKDQGTSHAGKVLTVDEKGQIVPMQLPEDSSEKMQSDRNETDETSAAYIKNKPFDMNVCEVILDMDDLEGRDSITTDAIDLDENDKFLSSTLYKASDLTLRYGELLNMHTFVLTFGLSDEEKIDMTFHEGSASMGNATYVIFPFETQPNDDSQFGILVTDRDDGTSKNYLIAIFATESGVINYADTIYINVPSPGVYLFGEDPLSIGINSLMLSWGNVKTIDPKFLPLDYIKDYVTGVIKTNIAAYNAALVASGKLTEAEAEKIASTVTGKTEDETAETVNSVAGKKINLFTK